MHAVDVFLCTRFSGSGYHHDANLVVGITDAYAVLRMQN